MTRKTEKYILLSSLLLLIMLVASSPRAAVAAGGTLPFSESFDSFGGSGFAPTPASDQLDSDIWSVTGFSDGDCAFGATCTSGDFARGASTGGVTTGGVYSFDTGSGNNSLGIQPANSDFTPGTVDLKIENNAGGTITSLSVEYSIVVYNDEPRANSLNFSYSTDGTNFTAIGALDFTTPGTADGSPSWTKTSRSTVISGLSIAPNAEIILRWTGHDVSGSGSRDEYGIDDVEVQVVTAVELATFTITPAASDTLLVEWQTATEIDHAGFNVYRSGSEAFDRTNATQLNAELIAAQGSFGQGASYSLLDEAVPVGVWYYFLEDIDIYGVSTVHDPLRVDTSRPTSTALTTIGGGSALPLLPAIVVLTMGVLLVAFRATLGTILTSFAGIIVRKDRS